MKTEVKKLDNGKKQINVSVSGDVVKNKFEEVFGIIAKEAKVPGFRAGHVPRDILEKNFASHAHEQVLKDLVPDLYNKAIEKEAIDAVDLPEISDVKLDRSAISFTATVEVQPEIKLKDYKGVKVSYKKIEVTADDVKRSLDSFKESRKIEAIDDALARSLGFPALVDLEKSLERQLLIQKENTQRQKIEHELVEAVSKGIEFALPQSLVSKHLQELVRQTKTDLMMKGVPREKITEHENDFVKDLEPQARTQVKTYMILSAIAKKENIAQDDHMPRHVMEFLLKNATWTQE